jgi:hypothetical protein
MGRPKSAPFTGSRSPLSKVARAAKYIALLALFLAAVSAAAGAVAARQYGTVAYQASALAAFLIWLVGGASLAIVASTSAPMARLNAALAAIFVRMALPLMAVVYVTRSDHPLADAGVVGLIMVHYLAGLVVETLMAVRIIHDMKASGSAGEPQKLINS